MIRRNLMHTERDPRTVKWSLMAAALALSIGSYADMVISASTEAQREAATTSVGDTSETGPAPVTIAGEAVVRASTDRIR